MTLTTEQRSEQIARTTSLLHDRLADLGARLLELARADAHGADSLTILIAGRQIAMAANLVLNGEYSEQLGYDWLHAGRAYLRTLEQ